VAQFAPELLPGDAREMAREIAKAYEPQQIETAPGQDFLGKGRAVSKADADAPRAGVFDRHFPPSRT